MWKIDEQTGEKFDKNGQQNAVSESDDIAGLINPKLIDPAELFDGREDLQPFLIALSHLNGFLSAHKPDELIPLERLDGKIVEMLIHSKIIPNDQIENVQAKVLASWVQSQLAFFKQYTLDDAFDSILKLLGQAKRPRRERIIKLIEATKNRLQRALEDSGAPLMQDKSDLRTYSTRLYDEMRKLIVELVEKSLITGELNSLALYSRPDLWINLGANKDYIPTKKGMELLEANLDEIIKLVSKNKNAVKVFDFGVGTGNKAELIIEKFLHAGKTIEYHAVDTSDKMLETAALSIVENLIETITEKIDEGKEEEEMKPWRPLIDFMKNNDFEKSRHQLLKDQLKRIFYKFTNPEFFNRFFSGADHPELLKHLVARALSLHVRKPGQDEQIKLLDTQIKFMVNFIPRCQMIETLNCKDYAINDNEEIVAFDLGCRTCNIPLSESVKDHTKFLSRADVKPIHDIPKKDIKAEAYVRAPYLVVGMQVRHKDENDPGYEEEKNNILEGYKTPEAEAFVLHPFTELKYRDSSGNELTFFQLRDKTTAEKKPYCEFITEYESDPQNPEEKRVVQKLRFNQPVTVIGNDETHLIKGYEILLMTSYKPTLEQVIELYTRNQIHICKIYKDDEKNPTYVKLVLRKMTPVEIEISTKNRIQYLEVESVDEKKKGFSFLELIEES